MLNDLYNETKKSMSKAIANLNSELSSSKRACANPKSNGQDYGGLLWSSYPINQLGNLCTRT